MLTKSLPVCLTNLAVTSLRQSQLCQADMALNMFEWHEDSPHPVDIHHTPHVCANQDKLEKFLEEHTVPPIGPILKHPWTGKHSDFRQKLWKCNGNTN